MLLDWRRKKLSDVLHTEIIRIEIDEKQMANIRKILSSMQSKTPDVLRQAINRTATNVRTNMSKEAAKAYNISSREVLKTIRIKRATKSHLSAKITSVGHTTPLINFKVTPSHPVRYIGGKGKKRPSPPMYKSSVEKNRGVKPLNGNPKAFVQTMKSGHIGVFERVPGKWMRVYDATSGKRKWNGKDKQGREKIKQLYGPSVPQMLKNEFIIQDITRKANNTLETRINHEINRILER